ncbi:hypothetical protein [Polyangium jinanense]|uniref:Uncharacterized protein n=1 Tax=Polyangium jinanense TaxID=2829994 RepID=A0A9X3XAX0_9BACT|nr:hypothetical protein [Polyangium jinanense]MDC3984511.1 hypothetical protein [Polyangium jinanense]
MKPTRIQDILDVFRLSYGGDGKVQRAEVVDASQVAHISGPSKPILPWHTYAGQKLPAETLEQVKEVRAMVRAFDPKFRKWPPLDDAKAVLLEGGSDLAKCYMFTDTPAFISQLVSELRADAMQVKASMEAESDPAVKTSLRVEYMKRMAFAHLMNGREGPTSAVNTYDKAFVTWGMGWALKGGLPKVLGRIYELEAAQSKDPERHYIQKLFYLCGFMYDAGRYYVVDTEQGTVWVDDLNKRWSKAAPGPGETPGQAVRVIHNTDELHFMWVQAARDDLTRATITNAQRDAFLSTTGTVPQADKIQTGALYTFIAHLQHWTGDKFDVVAWAQGPLARPRLTAPLPSEKGDAELAIQAVHRFYHMRSPNIGRNVFSQVRDYWKQMTGEDAQVEALSEFRPVYPVMTNGPVKSVPEGHLSATIDAAGKVIYDLGPLEDFGRGPPPPPNPAAGIIIIPPTIPEPVGEDPAAEDLAKEEARRASERTGWARLFDWF